MIDDSIIWKANPLPFNKRVIAIEGLDGTGKESVSKALYRMMNGRGIATDRISFPIYESPTGKVISEFLNGSYGDPTEVNPFVAAALYATDRLAFWKDYDIYQTPQKMLILDRSYYSNFIYQASKITDTKNLAAWMLNNFLTEFSTKSMHAFWEVYYLELDELHRQKQIADRAHLDKNESNLGYLQKCEQFVRFSRTPLFRATLNRELDHLIVNDPKLSNAITHYYLGCVKTIRVRHVDDPDLIETAVNETAEEIYRSAVRRDTETDTNGW